MSERTKIVLRMHDITDPTATPGLDNGSRDGNQIDAGNTLNLPFSPTKQQNFNALNVLAEASRRVGGDGPVASGYTAAEQAHPHDQTQPLPLDPQLEIDSFAQQLLESPDDGLSGRNNGKLQFFLPFFLSVCLARHLILDYVFQHSLAPEPDPTISIRFLCRLYAHLVLDPPPLTFLFTITAVNIYCSISNPGSRLSHIYYCKPPPAIFIHDKWPSSVSG